MSAHRVPFSIEIKEFLPSINAYLPYKHARIFARLPADYTRLISLQEDIFLSALDRVLNCQRNIEDPDENQSVLDSSDFITYFLLHLQNAAGFEVTRYKNAAIGVAKDEQTLDLRVEYMSDACLRDTVSLLRKIFPIAVSEKLVGGSFMKHLDMQKASLKDTYFNEAKSLVAANLVGVPMTVEIRDPNIFVFGEGFRKRKMFRHFSEQTSYLATCLSTDKHVTNLLLKQAGLPVPAQVCVTSIEDCCKYFDLFGGVVTLKPRTLDRGVGDFPLINSLEELKISYQKVMAYSNQMVMEQHIKGFNHRLMVLNRIFSSARRQIPASFTCDGEKTIQNALEEINRIRSKKGWALIPKDAETDFLLKKQGWSWEDIPAAGEKIYFRLQGNLSTGGTMELCTNEIHPHNIYMAQRAAEVLDIDIAGIDYITEDISSSFTTTTGAICEVNVTPGFIFEEHKDLLHQWIEHDKCGEIHTVVVIGPMPDIHLATCLTKILENRLGSPSYAILESKILHNGVVVPSIGLKTINLSAKNILQTTDARSLVVFYSFEQCIKFGIDLSHINLLILKFDPDTLKLLETNERLQNIVHFSRLFSNKVISASELGLGYTHEPNSDHSFCPICGEEVATLDRVILENFTENFDEIW